MKLSSILFIVILFYWTTTFAQETKPSLKGASTWIEQPDIIIKADELKNFPGGQLMEMLLGRLPGLDQINTLNQESKIVFIVDGVVWWDIDAININNIEEVAYYRGGLTSKLGFQNVGSGGVILITTKTGEFNQPFNAAINTIVGNSTFKNMEDNKNSTLQSYNVILNQGLEKFSWRTSAVLSKALNNMNEQDVNRNLQFNADIRFKLLDWLELEANANYAPRKGDFSFNQTSNYLDRNKESEQNKNSWNGLLVARIQPIKGLTNEVKFFKNRITEGLETVTTTTYSTANPRTSIEGNHQSSKLNSSTLINDLNYRFNADQDRIKFKIGAIYQYDHVRLNKKDYTEGYQNDEPNKYLMNGSEYNYGFNIHSVITDISVNLYDILALDAGIRRDKIKNDTTSNYAPFYHANVNLKKVLFNDVKGIDRIDFYHSSGKYLATTNILDIKEIPAANPPKDIDGPTHPNYIIGSTSNIYVSPLTLDQSKSTIQTYGVKSSFFNSRLHLAGELHNNSISSYAFFHISIPTMPGLTDDSFLRNISIKEEGWRIWTSADILRNSTFKWSTGLNVYKNNSKLTFISASNSQQGSKLNPYKPAIQTGMQQQFSYADFSLNLNGYAYSNHPGVSFDYHDDVFVHTFPDTKSTLINLNYIYLGYNFKKHIEKSSFKSLNIGIVSRNEFYHQKNLALKPSRTIGIALNANL